MFGLGRHGPDGKYAIVLDIGSASAGAAIVASDAITDENPIIFSHREWAVIKDADTDNPTRFIEEAILRAFLVLDSKGLKELKEYDKRARISHIQVALSAPWAHTVTQQAEYEDEEPFTITTKLVESLIETSKTESIENTDTTAFLKKQGLETITDQTLHITANGYTIKEPIGMTANKIYVSHSTGLASTRILNSIKEHKEKTFPGAKLTLNTFMLAFYTGVRDLYPDMNEACLVDITGEATEIGVVRNTELTRVSHSLIGIQTLSRMLADALDIPEGTARSLLLSGGLDLNERQTIVAESVFEEYREEIANLFTSLGDVLTVPKNVYLHTDRVTEEFFRPIIKRAAERATGGTHTILPVTANLFEQKNVNDTAILFSSYLFHKLHKQGTLTK